MFHLQGVKNRRTQNFHIVNQVKRAASRIGRPLWAEMGPVQLDGGLATAQYQLPSVYKG